MRGSGSATTELRGRSHPEGPNQSEGRTAVPTGAGTIRPSHAMATARAWRLVTAASASIVDMEGVSASIVDMELRANHLGAHVPTGTAANVATRTCAAVQFQHATAATTAESVLAVTAAATAARAATPPTPAVVPVAARTGVMLTGLAGMRLGQGAIEVAEGAALLASWHT